MFEKFNFFPQELKLKSKLHVATLKASWVFLFLPVKSSQFYLINIDALRIIAQLSITTSQSSKNFVLCDKTFHFSIYSSWLNQGSYIEGRQR